MNGIESTFQMEKQKEKNRNKNKNEYIQDQVDDLHFKIYENGVSVLGLKQSNSLKR